MPKFNVTNLLHTLLLTISCTCAGFAQAGVIVGGTRVIYDGSKHETSLSVSNPDKSPYLIQAWVDNDGPSGENKSTIKPPFIVTPPLFRLEAGGENMLRIIRSGGNIPADKESVYWMDVKSIPASHKGDKNVLQISIKTRIKPFYRPEGVKAPNEESYRTVRFNRSGAQLQVSNPTPNYLTFYSLKVGSTSLNTDKIMVPPKGTATYALPSTATGSQVSWQAINDFGGATPTITVSMQ
jgi:P pilus assembly chaperone PapD